MAAYKAVAERSGAMEAEAGTLESLTAIFCRHALKNPKKSSKLSFTKQ